MEEEQKFIEELLNPITQNQAFDVLVKRYQKRLYFHIRNIVINHDDAHDVLQNTFVKIFQNLSKFKGQSQLFSWIYRIATNEALSFVKQSAKKNKVSIEDFQFKIIENLTSDPYFDGDKLQIKLQLAIAQLPEKQQLVFKMRYFEELPYEQISEILGTSVGGLKASYHLAAKKVTFYITND